MKKLIPSLLACLVLITFPVFAQKDFRAGYIVTLQQDTLKGLVNYKGDVKSAVECTFKPDATAEEQNFKPEALKGYGFTGNKKYETKEISIVSRKQDMAGQFPEVPVTGHTNQNFMEILVQGKVTLYYLADATTAPHLYIQKDGGSLQELFSLEGTILNPATGIREVYQSKKYVGMLLLAFADCPDPVIKKKAERVKLHQAPLQQLISEYNNSLAPQQNVVNLRPKKKPTWGFALGTNTTFLKFEAGKHFLSQGKYNGNTDLTAGIFLELPLQWLNDKLSLHNRITYSHKKYNANYTVQDESYLRNNYDVYFDLTYLGLNPQLRYHFPATTIKPYIGAGVSGNRLLNVKQGYTKTVLRNGYEPEKQREQEPFEEFRKIEVGFNATVGASYPLNPKTNLFFETRLERGNGFSPYIVILTRTYDLSFQVGLEF